ncbi:hypothetical protein HW555_011598 [Spodoptera exigua]|uniref:Uncharacterized protein n=1 Tax=Spodoptera exigua TaxID=7107 RepID=A0A835G933_SPOEX|nr:hypothetical protein HW555_011598 [Spodoptera exigua]
MIDGMSVLIIHPLPSRPSFMVLRAGLVGSVVTGSGGGRFYHPTLRYWAVDRCPEQPFSGYQELEVEDRLAQGASSGAWCSNTGGSSSRRAKQGSRAGRCRPRSQRAPLLDKVTRRAWELKVSSDYKEELPTFDDLKEFLVNRFRALENLETKVERVPKTTRALHVVKDKGVSCAFCAGEHRISSCPKFINESTETRRNFVLKNKLCFICLLSNHSVKFCKNTLKCQVCKRRHHTLLHSQGVFGSEVGEGSSAARAESSSVTYEGNRDANKAEGSKPHAFPRDAVVNIISRSDSTEHWYSTGLKDIYFYVQASPDCTREGGISSRLL